MTEEPAPHPPQGPVRLFLLKFGIPAVAVLIVLVWGISKLAAPTSLGRPANSPPHSMTTPTDPEYHAMLATARVAQRTVLASIDEARKLCSRLEDAVRTWNDSKHGPRSLLTSDEGRFLAPNEDYVRTARALFNKDRPGTDFLDRMRTNINDLAAPIQAALDSNSPIQPSDPIRSAVARQKDEIESAIRSYDTDSAALRAMCDHAPQTGTRSPQTLAQAIAEFTKRENERIGHRIKEEIAAIDKEREEALRTLQVNEAKRKMDEDLDQARRAALHERCEQLANDPNVSELFREVITTSEHPNLWCYKRDRLGVVYHSKESFYYSFKTSLEKWHSNRANIEFIRRDDGAKQYGMTLYELFRVIAQYRRDLFMDEDACRRAAAAEKAKQRPNHDLIKALTAGPAGGAMPPPNTPPAPVE